MPTDNPNNPFVYPSAPTWEVGGITLRDLFAAYAPDNIPDWFKATGIPDAPRPVVLPPDEYFAEDRSNVDSAKTELYQSYYNSATEEWDNDQYNLDQGSTIEEDYPGFKWQVGEYTIDYKSYSHKYNVWNTHYQKERYFQWRWYYAQEMLLKREGDVLS